MADHTVEFGADPSASPDGRLDAAAFHRNHPAIWRVLDELLPDATGDVLEAGSGTGQHVVHFARHRPALTWWPSDLNDKHLASIDAWRAHSRLGNIRPPQRIDLADPAWPAAFHQAGGPLHLTAMFCANVVHIAPWQVAEGLFAGAAELLQCASQLVLYGPFKRGGRHTALSNSVFDESLRRSNPEWGVRDVDEIAALAGRCHLKFVRQVEMPANNLILVFAKP